MTDKIGTKPARPVFHDSDAAMNILAQFDRKVRDESDLLGLECEIARRADLLVTARGGPGTRQDDVACWLEAERQILQGTFSLLRPAKTRRLQAA